MSHVPGKLKRKKLYLVLQRERALNEKHAQTRPPKKKERDLFPEAAWRSAESGFTCSFPATHMQTFDSERNQTTRIASTCKPFHLHFLSAEKSKTLFIVPGLQKGRKKDSYNFRGMQVKNIYICFLCPLFFYHFFPFPCNIVVYSYGFGQSWPGTHELGARRARGLALCFCCFLLPPFSLPHFLVGVQGIHCRLFRLIQGAHCLEWMLSNACMVRECLLEPVNNHVRLQHQMSEEQHFHGHKSNRMLIKRLASLSTYLLMHQCKYQLQLA